jgi:hypothetical protein
MGLNFDGKPFGGRDSTRYDTRSGFPAKQEKQEVTPEMVAARQLAEEAMWDFAKKVKADGWESSARQFSIPETDERIAIQQTFYSKKEHAQITACFGPDGSCKYLAKDFFDDRPTEVIISRIPVSIDWLSKQS